MPDPSANFITARLVTLVAELLLLGLGVLLVLAEYRRGRRTHLRPLLVALGLLVVVVGTYGSLNTSQELNWILHIPFVAALLGVMQATALVSFLTHAFQLVDSEGDGAGRQVVRWGLWLALGIGIALGLYYQLPGIYGIQSGALVARVLFDLLLLALAGTGFALIRTERHPLQRLMLVTLGAWGCWALADLAFGRWPPVVLGLEAIAIVSVVAFAVLQVTAELTSIAIELHHTSASLAQAQAGLRQLSATATSLVRAGSVRSIITVLLDVLTLQFGLRQASLFLLNPVTNRWECFRRSGLSSGALKSGELPMERRQFLTEVILAGQPVAYAAATAQWVDQDFLTVTGFSKQVAVIPLQAPRVSYNPHGDPAPAALQRGSAWKSEPCWLADRICMQGLGNFPQRLDTCRTCAAFEPLGAIVVDLRQVDGDQRPTLEVLETVGHEASLALRDLMQVEELVTDIRFRTAALDPLGLGIVLLGPDGRITAINRMVRQIAGPKAAGWLGQPVGEVPFTTQPERLGRLIETIVKKPSETATELGVEIVGPQGLRQCQLRLHPLLRHHVLTGILCTVEDKTETLEMQRTILQQERFAAMGQLAMGIAHEVNNPIAGVSGLLQVLAKRLGPETPEHRPIQTALNDLRRASETIRNLLQFARPRPAQLKAVEINRLVEEVVDLQTFHPLASNVVMRLDLAADLPEARTDRESLAQVLTNLMLNALQAMGGTGEIQIGTYATARRLLISVKDTGPGIPEDILPRIFEPFFTTKKSGQGTGLGLALCEMILGGLSASLAVVSDSGGTEFLVILPRATPAPELGFADRIPSEVAILPPGE